MDSGVKETFNKNSTWCRRRTNMERCLILLSLVIFLIALVLVITLSVVLHKLSDAEDEAVCSTPGCIHAASRVLKYIDEAVEPCDDFYTFACGNYLRQTVIPEDKDRVSQFHSLHDTVRDQLKLIIEEPLPPTASKPERLIKKIYEICMNTTAIEEDGLITTQNVMKELGGWPLLEGNNWDENKFEWKQAMYKFRRHGFGGNEFLWTSIGTDEKNSTRRIIKIDDAPLGLRREFLVKGPTEKFVQAYYDYMVDISVLYGAKEADALKELNATLDFEIKLANITLPKEESRNSTALYNPMTIKELQENYPFIPWLEYINNVLDIHEFKITENEVVIVSVPEFMNKLEKLLRETPKRVQANYIMRNWALSSIFYLTDNFRNRQREYYKTLYGQVERESRWKECTRLATGSLRFASGSTYARKYFKMDVKKHAEEMVSDIRAQFVKILKEVDWMDKTTKKNALEKANSMIAYIAFPEELFDQKKINKFYSKLEIHSSNYFKSMKSVGNFFMNYYKSRFREPINKTEWISHSIPTVVNAFYSSLENSIEFPAGILQGVFFDEERPRYMNYGAIGYVIGHEITHGFDDEGRQFDKDGNLNDWWEEDTKKAFMEKAQCIIEQYGNYTVPEVELNLNGINTQGENIADNGGIKEAYLAYQAWVERNGAEPRLPGLHYTPNQMFWISAANVWCSKQRKEALKLQVTTGSHSPSQFRILGPFSNSEYFAKDFNCPLGSTMNPVHKCQVW